MNLLKDETILTASEDNRVILTTHRIRYDAGSNGDSTMTSIMLEHISSVQLNTRSYPILLLIGFVLIVSGFITSYQSYGPSAQPVLLVIGFIVGILYFFTKQHTCIISSDGGSRIEFSTTNMRRQNLLEFIDKIEDAQSKRTNMNSHS